LRRPGAAWCAVAAALLVGSLLCFAFDAARALEWQPSLAATQPWRWWSAAFVHYSTLHLVGNLTGLALTAAFGWVTHMPPRAALAWFAAWPLTHLAFLWWVPDLLHYGGLSGVVHAGVAIVITQVLISGNRGQRAVVATVLVGLLTKIATETPWREAVQRHEGWDIGIAPMAHVTGVLSGTACLLLAQLWSRRHSRNHDDI
ncbi:MAG TPA: rhombosortase, partial [Rhizobacter sp.]|nr:rhombosortase [Rhizobacter sp.]